ncbi:hypothetical protein GYH30_013847 [Glycine max]|uniref:Uncharacterized protein n=2 Tax=Glycine subgen. Soja TaxID=1462606 RepID=A0A0R0JAP3_SOYBN|nr:hypothetical protein GYH30_013847 [Glycine max]RZC05385.1 hypothetical protein D0Y65_013511 [Glycine soja]
MDWQRHRRCSKRKKALPIQHHIGNFHGMPTCFRTCSYHKISQFNLTLRETARECRINATKVYYCLSC